MSYSSKDRAFARFMADTGNYLKAVVITCKRFIKMLLPILQVTQFLLFVAGIPTVKTTVTSSDSKLTVVGSPCIARKKNQRRRPRAERTTVRK